MNDPIFTGDSYEIVPWANGQECLYFERFGSYQGEWIIIAADQKQYLVYKDYYGSCSGCDSFEATFSFSMVIKMDKAKDFAEAYPPFLEITKSTMINLVENGVARVKQILPKNINDRYSDISLDDVANNLYIIAKLREGINIDVEDILNAPNAELRRFAIEHYGLDRFLTKMEAKLLDADGDDKLIMLSNGWVALVLQDSSTPRKYFLRVPDGQKLCRQAKAWTFELSEAEYQPLIET